MLKITYIASQCWLIINAVKNIFENFSLKNWQHQKFISIFASQNIRMQRKLKLHIETSNRFSPKVGYTVCGACNAEE